MPRLPHLALALLLGAPSTSAQFALAARPGTLGLGLEASALVMPNVGLRAGANFFTHSFTRTESDVTFDAELEFKAVTALVDIYPSARGTFHFTGGVTTAPARVNGRGQPTDGSYTLNGHEYTAAEVGVVVGRAQWPDLLPYAGIGWGTAAAGGIMAFVFDLGVAIGRPTIELSATSAVPGSTLAQDVAAEAADIQREADRYARVYPVISLGLMIRL
jgi:hypothetical protein